MENLPQRKPLRLRDYDYSQAGYYFVTVCVKDGECILCRGEQGSPEGVANFTLSKTGEVVEAAINNIEKYYSNIRIDHYTIMPNHLHMIVIISMDQNGRTLFAPTLSRIIKQFKGYVTKQIGYSIWQKSYHDHIIRNEQAYQEIYNYIETNPLKWKLDRYYRD
ncbi:transposase [Geosporobacter ferrireducens]|uniref:transposase n=1 Tax=Geosporobacter ferrireducens TaxID=1424294 RepID=UPI00139B52AA|nr:transposase [Geosporobacter ferrireducens]MTI55453.1 transposase [Geosporobacter ferrireducens]